MKMDMREYVDFNGNLSKSKRAFEYLLLSENFDKLCKVKKREGRNMMQ